MSKIAPLIEFKNLKRVHFIGVGGIGMSSIAQFLCDCGIAVTGSDRAVDKPENSLIFDALRGRGIVLFPQDGSFLDAGIPDLIVYSTAIEDDNADFAALPDVPRIHRAEMLNLSICSLSEKKSIAVSGSCGKTSVTAWLSETLFNAGADPVMIGGGLSNRFTAADLAGNYRPGNGEYFVFEADESDKSLLNYHPDYALLLNIGTDHYEEQELIAMFRQFARQIKTGVVVSHHVYELLGSSCFEHLKVAVFDDNKGAGLQGVSKANWIMKEYRPGKAVVSNLTEGRQMQYEITLPMPGRHSGLNALAVLGMMELLGFCGENIIRNAEDFNGVWRRSDFAGKNMNGAKVYDDYAHNVEKIISCIKTAREGSDRVLAVFQPHGFSPLEFMRDPLFDALEDTLSEEDVFCMLPVYYAGGSASFSPTSDEVISSYCQRGTKKYFSFNDRNALKSYLGEISGDGDTVLLMGARDNSLSSFAKQLAGE